VPEITQERFGDATKKGETELGGGGNWYCAGWSSVHSKNKHSCLFILLFFIMTSYRMSEFMTV
jgi:hypothetical protein